MFSRRDPRSLAEPSRQAPLGWTRRRGAESGGGRGPGRAPWQPSPFFLGRRWIRPSDQPRRNEQRPVWVRAPHPSGGGSRDRGSHESLARHRGQRGLLLCVPTPSRPSPPPFCPLQGQRPARQASPLPTFSKTEQVQPLQGQQKKAGLQPCRKSCTSNSLAFSGECVAFLFVVRTSSPRKTSRPSPQLAFQLVANIQVQLLSSLQRELDSPWRMKFMNTFRLRAMQTLKAQGRL